MFSKKKKKKIFDTCKIKLDLTYFQYFFNWTCIFVLNIQWQVVMIFNLHFLFS